MKAAKKKNIIAQGKKEYLRFIIHKLDKHGSMHLSHLIGHLSELSRDIRKCVGSRMAEVKIFLRKYTNIFEIDHDDIVHLLNHQPKETRETETKPKYQSSSNTNDIPEVITHGKGRVLQLFSQTGFIRAYDPFETKIYFSAHHFGDTNRQLLHEFNIKEDTVLHFNAVREPPGSLSVYRSTKVWFPKKNNNADPCYAQNGKNANTVTHTTTGNKAKGKIEHVFDKYGFITTENTGKNSVFFRMRSVVNDSCVGSLKDIMKEGDLVEFCAVKSVKADSLAPWEASQVFLKKNAHWSEISVDEDEVFRSSSSSADSEFESAQTSNITSEASNIMSEALVDVEKVSNTEYTTSALVLPTAVVLSSSSPDRQKPLRNSSSGGFDFSGRIFIRSDDDAVIISTKRHSCDVALVDTDALYVDGRRTSKVSDIQNGQYVRFRATKDGVIQRWVTNSMWTDDASNRDPAKNEREFISNDEEDSNQGCDTTGKSESSGRVEPCEGSMSSDKHNWNRIPVADTITMDVAEHTKSSGEPKDIWRKMEEGKNEMGRSFRKDLKCFCQRAALKNQCSEKKNCTNSEYFMQESKRFGRCNLRDSTKLGCLEKKDKTVSWDERKKRKSGKPGYSQWMAQQEVHKNPREVADTCSNRTLSNQKVVIKAATRMVASPGAHGAHKFTRYSPKLQRHKVHNEVNFCATQKNTYPCENEFSTEVADISCNRTPTNQKAATMAATEIVVSPRVYSANHMPTMCSSKLQRYKTHDGMDFCIEQKNINPCEKEFSTKVACGREPCNFCSRTRNDFDETREKNFFLSLKKPDPDNQTISRECIQSSKFDMPCEETKRCDRMTPIRKSETGQKENETASFHQEEASRPSQRSLSLPCQLEQTDFFLPLVRCESDLSPEGRLEFWRSEDPPALINRVNKILHAYLSDQSKVNIPILSARIVSLLLQSGCQGDFRCQKCKMTDTHVDKPGTTSTKDSEFQVNISTPAVKNAVDKQDKSVQTLVTGAAFH